ncbi:MAG: hypothetical protein LBV27_00765 [Oscillospiraceae bacterium]|jgi:hypothetical protein|nr:hypothetical protein [Oscillospiraceae bacterium]
MMKRNYLKTGKFTVTLILCLAIMAFGMVGFGASDDDDRSIPDAERLGPGASETLDLPPSQWDIPDAERVDYSKQTPGSVISEPAVPLAETPVAGYEEHHYYSYVVTQKIRTGTESKNVYFVTVDDSDARAISEPDVLSMAAKISAGYNAKVNVVNFYLKGTPETTTEDPIAVVEVRPGQPGNIISFKKA